MSLENILGIVSLILAVVCYIGYRYSSEVVHLKYKEQRVGPNNEKEGMNK